MELTFPRACVICRNINNIYIKSNFRLSRCSTTSHPTWQYNAREYEKSAQRDANTACQKFSPRRRPPSRRRRTAKILSAGDGHYLHLQTEFGEDRCTQFRVIVVTDTARPPQTHTQTGPITIHCAAMLSAQCKKLKREKARRVTHHIMRSMRCSHLALTMTLP